MLYKKHRETSKNCAFFYSFPYAFCIVFLWEIFAVLMGDNIR